MVCLPFFNLFILFYSLLLCLIFPSFQFLISPSFFFHSSVALFIYVKGTLPATSDLMSKIYEEHKKDDGFLYMTYNGESTFGSNLED